MQSHISFKVQPCEGQSALGLSLISLQSPNSKLKGVEEEGQSETMSTYFNLLGTLKVQISRIGHFN